MIAKSVDTFRLAVMTPVFDADLTLVGPGRAGRAFLRSWLEAGGRRPQVISRTPDTAGLATLPGLPGLPVRALDGPLDAADVLILAVADDAIASCAARLAGRLPCAFAFHLSGALPAEVLAPLRREGAAVASLHPLRPFTGAATETWHKAFVAVEGDAEACARGEAIARGFGAAPHRLDAGRKPLYHAAASLAAGGTVAVLSLAVRAAVSCGIPEDVARKALAGLASEASAAAARAPFALALTGAVARRDVGTVRAHVEALEPYPEILALYATLAVQILAATPGRGAEAQILSLLRVPGEPGRGASEPE